MSRGGVMQGYHLASPPPFLGVSCDSHSASHSNLLQNSPVLLHFVMALQAVKSVPVPLSETDEVSPLLATGAASDINSPSPSRVTLNRRAAHWPYAALLCGLLSLVADLGDGITAAPEVRLLEMAVCRDHYRAHEPRLIGPPPLSYVPENYCKVKDIQVELAYLRAVLKILTTVPGYFHTLFPVRLVWASSLFQFMGGGHRVIGAIMNTIIVDVAPETARTTSFYVLGAAIRVTDMLAAVAGSALLERDMWLPYEIATPVLLLALPICLAMPETLVKTTERTSANAKAATSSSEDSGAARSSSSSSAAAESSAAYGPPFKGPSLGERLKTSFIVSPASLLSPLSLSFLVVFLKTFALASNTLFLQYASAALSWSIARAGYLLSIKGALSLAVLIGLPVLGRWLTGGGAKRRIGEVERNGEALEDEEDGEEKAVGTRMVDVWVARGSLGLLAVGCWCVAGAGAAGQRGPAVMVFGLILLSLGNGITQTMRGLVAHFSALGPQKPRSSRPSSPCSPSSSSSSSPHPAPPRSPGTGNLYGTLVLFELAAILLGNAAFAALYGAGADLSGSGGAWLGLPFWVAGIIFFLAMLVAAALPARE
ncbi:hypothetical protein IWX46DRAFT_235141 [Phyllosticta citricarpa]|uniref:Uncharacterized protein n=1 Tax=Phyllosticta citricarpa TaxID=55181 RepID=A0ABR1LYS8_9PEZI